MLPLALAGSSAQPQFSLGVLGARLGEYGTQAVVLFDVYTLLARSIQSLSSIVHSFGLSLFALKLYAIQYFFSVSIRVGLALGLALAVKHTPFKEVAYSGTFGPAPSLALFGLMSFLSKRQVLNGAAHRHKGLLVFGLLFFLVLVPTMVLANPHPIMISNGGLMSKSITNTLCDTNFDFCVQADNDNTSYSAQFKCDITAGSTIRFSRKGEVLEMQPLGLYYTNSFDQLQQISMPQLCEVVTTNNVLNYSGAYGPGLSLSYTTLPNKLKEELRIEKLSSLPPIESYINSSKPMLEWSFLIIFNTSLIVRFNDTAWDKNTDTVVKANLDFINPDTGEVVYSMLRPEMIDANGNSLLGAFMLKKQGKKYYVSIKLDYNWLSYAKFPVMIDPTLVVSGVTIEGQEITPISPTQFVIVWGDETADDATYAVYFTNGSCSLSATDIDTVISSDFGGISVSALNSTSVMVLWQDDSTADRHVAQPWDIY
ncbi:MAG: hypothetical protein DRP42_05260, partial [Tenericutes bacterium]